MAVIRDIIPAFELFQPASIDDAVRLIDKYRGDYWVLAGGLDSMDWLKDRLRRPRYVIDLTQIKELVGIKDTGGGLEIGAMTPLTQVVHHPVVRDKFGLLAEAAELVAAAGQYFVGPGIDITRMTTLQPGELLTSIRIPATWAGAQFYFEKVRDRQVWDFPLVNVASAIKFSNGKVDAARIVVGAVAATPKRLANVEAAIVGKARDEATADMAGRMAVEGAVTLRYNGYKVPLMRNLVKRAIRGSEGGTWTS